MTDPDNTDTPIESLTDLPIQPTGSGVADLEIAYEQMRLAEDAEDAAEPQIAEPDATPTEDAAESAAHPS
ncbi:MAG TPA: hypothetical protein VF638_08735 [Sphingomonas sp.]